MSNQIYESKVAKYPNDEKSDNNLKNIIVT